MSTFCKIVLYDYLQRARSYAFLLTIAISLFAAYSFVPTIDANYSTIRIGDYVGAQNAAWIGYVTAMMTSVFLSLIGFFLVNSGIQKDIDTGVGMIIATTSISNFNYLLAKACSNFLVLLSITACVFLMGIGLFFIRSYGYPFEITQFILPYLLITIPAIFFIAAFAATAEVFLHRYTIVMNISFFIFFGILSSLQAVSPSLFDFFGINKVIASMKDIVQYHYHQTNLAVSMGFNFDDKKAVNFFVFEGIHWSLSAVFSRLFWICFGVLLIFISSKFFHRFEIKERIKTKKKIKFPGIIIRGIIPPVKLLHDIKLSELPPITPSYRIMPFIKTELLMLIRKGPRWLWIINFAGMIALVFAPLTVTHQIILPILWFLQVGRWSDLATKEKTNRIHYFTYASYKPLTRLLPAQILAGIILSLVLASPLLVRYLAEMQFLPILSIIMGGVFIVLFSVTLGLLSGGKKLFEILFFIFTYANIERIPFTDYFGGINHSAKYLAVITLLIAFLTLINFMLRKSEIRRL
jgi:hypothetical protein